MATNLVFPAPTLLGAAKVASGPAPIPGATWYTANAIGDGLSFQIPRGSLASLQYITADLLLEGTENTIFALSLYQVGTGTQATGEAAKHDCALMSFGLLNSCAARMRVPLDIVHQNRWLYEREGAWLKPCCYGQRVDLAKVDRVTLTVFRMGNGPVRWCMTGLRATATPPALLTEPVLPKGPLLDPLGQSTLHDWPAKTRSVEDCVRRLNDQAADAAHQKWPASFSKWGGYAEGPRLAATGYFRTHHDGRRWFLVDPDGYLFWSAGMDCMGPRSEAKIEHLEKALAWLPEGDGPFRAAFNDRGNVKRSHFSFLVANFIRAFGPDRWHEQWAKISLSQLRAFGINTVANWSDWKVARAASFPYVRPLNPSFPTTPSIFRDFPDVFHPSFANDCAAFAHQLDETLGDPALIGYFLMNEPTWGFAAEVPAVGMLYNTPTCETRKALAEFLRRRHGTDAKLAEAWGVFTSYSLIAAGPFMHPLNDTALRDLTDFSTVMVERLYRGLSDACKKVDPHHLNLGARYYTVPPAWCLEGMKCFDVFSLNAYEDRIPGEKYDYIAKHVGRPVLAGEWHFGALDVGLPATGVGSRVATQADRGKAYRIYLEDAARNLSCVGVHHFQMYDQSALGRFDGENYNIGFVDTCNRPYEALAMAARAAHERMYQIALGQVEPYAERPEYLPRLFI